MLVKMSIPLHLAVWSGPRNISTALMRSWGNRADTRVIDEPFYAHYLERTGKLHPGFDEVIASQPTEWRRVVDRLVEPLPEGLTIDYQKQMAQHLLPEIEREWMDSLTHVFLIRDPREMLTSFLKIVEEPVIEDTGLPQQVELFERMRRLTGQAPPVFESRDILEAPEAMLRLMCQSVGVPFDPAMLEWPAGPRETDGVWAKYWYGQVEQSTTFRPYQPKPDAIPPRLEGLYRECVDLYGRLEPYCLRTSS